MEGPKHGTSTGGTLHTNLNLEDNEEITRISGTTGRLCGIQVVDQLTFYTARGGKGYRVLGPYGSGKHETHSKWWAAIIRLLHSLDAVDSLWIKLVYITSMCEHQFFLLLTRIQTLLLLLQTKTAGCAPVVDCMQKQTLWEAHIMLLVVSIVLANSCNLHVSLD